MRVSVTTVEQLNYLRNSEYGDSSVKTIVAQINREGEETEAMRRGTAFHHVLETFGNTGVLDQAARYVYHEDGNTHVCCDKQFVPEGADWWEFEFDFTMEGELILPAIRELKGELQMVVHGVPVTLSGKVDAIDGNCVHDHKLTSSFDTEQYEDSVQWRCYLRMFNADVFQYNLFEQYTSKKTAVVNVKRMHTLKLYRYPGLDEDVEDAVGEFVEFCRRHCPEKLTDDSLDVKQFI